MCGRVAVPERDLLLEYYNLKPKGNDWVKDINVPPTGGVPVISNESPNELDFMNWSLLPWYTKADPDTGKPIHKLSTFNARYDKLFESNLWKPLLGKNHCVVITDGYYEWEELDEWADAKKKKKKKQPHFIRAKSQDFTLLAGLYSPWVNKITGEIFKTCAVITHDAVEAWGKLHDRMPAFLTDEGMGIWLNKELPLEERLKVIQPKSEDFLESFKINEVGNRDEFEHVVFK
jgi:putative SOS response-associated peptidase YedK